MEPHERLLLANRAWVQERVKLHSDYFAKHAHAQAPEFLWIGCSDSRVPAEEITGAEPGELFVHRNIANLVLDSDFNLLSVLQYAVEVLKVKHVIVCGHYNCGGVKHAMTQQGFGPLSKWLSYLKELYFLRKDQIESIVDPQVRWDRLAEISVNEQIQNLAKTDIVQRTWLNEQRPLLHGWIYNLRTGYLNELTLMRPEFKLNEVDRVHAQRQIGA
jgi:carbonic anhydrase